MSFPSAAILLETTHSGRPDEALLGAIQRDTPLGYQAVAKLSELSLRPVSDPLTHLKELMRTIGSPEETVLRCEPRGEGFKADFDPNSELGRQLSRILGTDATRPLIAKHLAVEIGFANCCGVIVSCRREDVLFTSADQISWQSKPDC